jgi:prefoldin alpha subunit
MEQQEAFMKLQVAYQQAQELEEKMGIVNQQMAELQQFEISLKDLGENKSKEILASLGKGVFVKSDIKEDELFVDVGSGVFVRKTIDEARKVVSEQLVRLNEIKMQIAAQNEAMSHEMQALMQETEKPRV